MIVNVQIAVIVRNINLTVMNDLKNITYCLN